MSGGDQARLEPEQDRANQQQRATSPPGQARMLGSIGMMQSMAGNQATAHFLQRIRQTDGQDQHQRPPALLRLAPQAGNQAVGHQVQQLSLAAPTPVQREESSNPEDMEEQLEQTGALQRLAEDHQPEVSAVQRAADGNHVHTGAASSWAKPAASGFVVQRRGGPKVGTLCVVSNVVSAGLTAGHAWLSYTPDGGTETTYGTWGNLTPKGLYRDREVGRAFAAKRCTDVDAADVTALDTFAAGNNTWTLTNNCSSFAARGWYAITGEGIDHTSMGIPNPSALGAGITAANGGATGVLAAGGGGASSGSSAGGGSGGSSGGGSSGGSSSL